MKPWHITLILVLVAGILAGCGGDASTSSAGEASAVSAASGGSDAYISAVLDTSYEGALPVSSQLALGTFQLEGTENAVTPEQAKTLLPLWQSIQGGTLQSDVETNAVLKQIEGAMTAEQLAAIAAMQLTNEALETWMPEQGVSLAPPQGEAGLPSGEGSGQAGQEGWFGNMSEEERAAIEATVEAGGGTFPGRQGAAGRGQLAMIAGPLVELLEARAGEG